MSNFYLEKENSEKIVDLCFIYALKYVQKVERDN